MRSLVKLRSIIFLWFFWVLLLVGYQLYVQARFVPKRPDYALSWTPPETGSTSQNGKAYLLEPFLNDHVSWDSEYYLSIAVGGYQDPRMRALRPDFTWNRPRDSQVKLNSEEPTWLSENYAFFPFYPLVTRVVAFPLGVFGLNPIATATLAGVLVSVLGTLGAMVSLYDLTQRLFGESEARRAVFYLLIFPAAMFLAQVYTEGLFLGLSFGALALVRCEKWLWAGVLAAAATWTRAAGALLLLPMAWTWWQCGGWKHLTSFTSQFSWAEIGKVILVCSPVWAFLIWQGTLGGPFQIIESRFYSRAALALAESAGAWSKALESLLQGGSQTQAYYLVEFAAVILGFVTCAVMRKWDRVLALYSLATIVFSMTTGVAMGMHRYVLAAPALFMIPARWGKNEVFDRAWTFGNILLLGVFTAMFSFDFWAG